VVSRGFNFYAGAVCGALGSNLRRTTSNPAFPVMDIGRFFLLPAHNNAARHMSRYPVWIYSEWLGERSLRICRVYARNIEINLDESVMSTRRYGSSSESRWANKNLCEARLEDAHRVIIFTKLTNVELATLRSLYSRQVFPWPHYRGPLTRLGEWTEHWKLALEGRGIDSSVATECLLQLYTKYSSADLSYHNQHHIQECLNQIESFEEFVDYEYENSSSIMLAIFYHDAIYDPTSSTNEEDSAELFRQHAEVMGLEQEMIKDTSRLILITKNHHKATSIDEQVIADVDRAILASEPDRYDEYARAIREEYRCVDDSIFNAGRAAFLKSQLQLEPIFFTEWAKAQDYERVARANLYRELEWLK